MPEYAIMLALICVICAGAVGTLGLQVNRAFNRVATCMKTGGQVNPGGVCAGNAGFGGEPKDHGGP